MHLPRSRKTANTPQALVPDLDRSGIKPAFDVEAYNSVARTAKLQGLSLVRSNFAVLPEYFLLIADNDAPRPRYSAEFEAHTFNQERGRAACEWRWTLKVSAKQKTALSIDTVYVVVYGGLENCNANQVVHYMKRVGRFSTYPYFRAHVSQLSWESGAKLPILPTIST
jgi:hypothetical protein